MRFFRVFDPSIYFLLFIFHIYCAWLWRIIILELYHSGNKWMRCYTSKSKTSHLEVSTSNSIFDLILGNIIFHIIILFYFVIIISISRCPFLRIAPHKDLWHSKMWRLIFSSSIAVAISRESVICILSVT